jgi:hypothetical protein
MSAIHDVSFEKDSVFLYASDVLAADSARLTPVDPFHEMFSAHLTDIEIFAPEKELRGAPFALLR